MKRILFVILGWMFVVIAMIGVVLPILPTTPFLIVALFCFARSSKRCHQMLLNNRFFGEGLRDWENNKIVKRKIKIRATCLIVLTFSLSIWMLYPKLQLDLMLFALMTVLLFFIWRLPQETV
ncbi:MAG: YbaN family protein [Saccharospirillaceae bacterium]|nr:YbaN family protein [Pseudomonadales bacterium]NRB78773.1 YbaN family protein [Saccharospirillaceae bacterium]